MPTDLAITGFEDPPGVTASIGEALGGAGVNVEGVFGSGKLGEIHLLVDDVETARRAIEDAGLRRTPAALRSSYPPRAQRPRLDERSLRSPDVVPPEGPGLTVVLVRVSRVKPVRSPSAAGRCYIERRNKLFWPV